MMFVHVYEQQLHFFPSLIGIYCRATCLSVLVSEIISRHIYYQNKAKKRKEKVAA